MRSEKKTQYCLYKIYSENCLLYIGRTKQPLQTRLHGHFFKKPMHREINIDCVTKIEYALFPTEADMNVFEVYLINLFKPPLNRDDKAKDALTIRLPDVEFVPFECRLMDKWKAEIHERDMQHEELLKKRAQLECERRQKRKEIFRDDSLTLEEKENAWDNWLTEVYEPVRNGLW